MFEFQKTLSRSDTPMILKHVSLKVEKMIKSFVQKLLEKTFFQGVSKEIIVMMIFFKIQFCTFELEDLFPLFCISIITQ